jgi:hypothetical protein
MLSGHVCTFTNAAGKLNVSVFPSEFFEDGFVGVADFNRTSYVASPPFSPPSSSRDTAYLKLVREGHRIFLSIDAAWLPLGEPEGQVLDNGLVGWVKYEMKD